MGKTGARLANRPHEKPFAQRRRLRILQVMPQTPSAWSRIRKARLVQVLAVDLVAYADVLRLWADAEPDFEPAERARRGPLACWASRSRQRPRP
jgi:hypothetical protein